MTESRAVRFLDVALDGLSLVLVAFVFWALLDVHVTDPPLREDDPDRAVELLQTRRTVFNESGLVYGVVGDSGKTMVITPLTPALARRLAGAGIAVEPRPDYPGWSPVLFLAFLPLLLAGVFLVKRHSPLLEDERRWALRTVMVLAGVTTIYTVNWAQGAYVDTSGSGIYRRAVTDMPPSLLAQPIMSTGMDDQAWRGRLPPPEVADSARLIHFRRFMIWENYYSHLDQVNWSADRSLIWLLGLLVIGLFSGRIGSAEPRARSAWMSVYFVVLIALFVPYFLDRSYNEPGVIYWSWFLASLTLCWQSCIRFGKMAVSTPHVRAPTVDPGRLP